MSATTGRLTKLRNLASHPATPPAEAAAARARIADIEARNPQAKERSTGADEFIHQQRIIREYMDRMTRQFEEQKRAREREEATQRQSNSEDDGPFWWESHAEYHARKVKSKQSTPRPDPFAGWADMPDPVQAARQAAQSKAEHRTRQAKTAAMDTYGQVAHHLHEAAGIQITYEEWGHIILDLLQKQSR